MTGDAARDPGDAWVEGPGGERFWGRFGAAGLLAVDPARGVLLQHRVGWSHFGGTWALPGGARHEGESAIDAALREAAEEAGVPTGPAEAFWSGAAVRMRATSVFDVGYWSYVTVLADVTEPFEPVISDPESVALAWVEPAGVDALPLHPGFAASWPTLREMIALRPVVVVDAANVVGSVPDGWWRDRAGAAERLLARLDALAASGVEAAALGLPGTRWFPMWRVVLEGRATDAEGQGSLEIVRARGAGDDRIVAETEALVAETEALAAGVETLVSGSAVTVVTSDRELAARCEAVGARTRGAGWLLALLETA